MPVLKALDLIRDTKPVYAHPDETIQQAVEKMASHNVGSLPIVDNEMRIKGIFTERDLVHLLARHGPNALRDPLEKHMTRQLVTAHPDDPIPALAHKMIEHGIRHIPVVDTEGKLLGVVSIRRILRHLLASNEWP